MEKKALLSKNRMFFFLIVIIGSKFLGNLTASQGSSQGRAGEDHVSQSW